MSPEQSATLVARALGIQGALDMNGSIATLPAWDSLAHVRLLLEIETELGRSLTPDEIVGINSVAAVVALLASI